MIATFVPIIVALAYIGSDAFLAYYFFRNERKLRKFHVGAIILLKFKQLMNFYARSETSLFLHDVVSEGSSLDTSMFSESYDSLSKEIEEFYKEFRLPYRLMELPKEMKSTERQLIFLFATIAALSLLSFTSNIILTALLFSLLLNTVFFYPLFSLFYEVRGDISEAAKLESSMKAVRDES